MNTGKIKGIIHQSSTGFHIKVPAYAGLHKSCEEHANSICDTSFWFLSQRESVGHRRGLVGWRKCYSPSVNGHTHERRRTPQSNEGNINRQWVWRPEASYETCAEEDEIDQISYKLQPPLPTPAAHSTEVTIIVQGDCHLCPSNPCNPSQA